MTSNAPVMLGMTLPDVDVWSERVTVALGQNPSVFSGPGTNTYLIGTGPQRLLVDPGQGMPAYISVLEQAMERCGCEGFQEIVLTHGHPDHIGGVRQVLKRFGDLKISKKPWPGVDEAYDLELTPIDDGSVIKTEGATLRALHTPGHAPDHLCFMIEEERSLISGDNVLGVGTTVIPAETGDLTQYMASLERLRRENPSCIYPAHGPKIEDGMAKLDEYIAHRHERERQIVAVLEDGAAHPMDIVKIVYASYPEALHPAASQSVTQHLMKLERDGRTRRDGKDPILASWSLS
ncbi:MAG: beta-lactamase-like protein 2 [Deltaproteobacteria bacterium]|nr:beta-lactamase-like protein 2 [Deltaproteobacteria bacterium]